jgi:hypothetical protein
MNLTANTTISIATEGTVNITVCANNTLGSSNCTSVMVINDLSGPVLTAQQNAFSPSTAYINTQNENFTFNSTWSDETNISRLFFEIDTVNHTATNISAWNFYAIANLSIGDHAFRWFAFDFFNKSSATNMAYIRVGFNCSGGINSTNIGYSNSSGGNALLELLLDNRTTLTASSAAISSSINIINISLLAPSAGAPNGSSFISGYEINATTNDSLSICFNYSAAINSTMNDSTIAVYRKGNTDSDWTNVTTNLDNASRLACGNVASAQTPYVLAAQNNNPAPTPTPSPTATQAQAYTGGGSADGAPSGFATSRESPTPAPTQTPIPASTPAPAAEEQPEARARDGEIFSRINETERLLENSIGALSDYSIASARKYLAKARSLVYAGRHEEALSALAYARRAIETGNAAATGGTTGKQERLAPVPRQAVGAGYVLADYAMPLYAIAAAAGLAAAIGAARLFRAKTEWNN